jgi:UDP-N-acetylmuramate dehydrogenase
MKIQKNFSLQNYNTFGIDVHAAQFAVVRTEKELLEILNETKNELYIIGGGSNLLLTQDISGLVVKIALPGVEFIQQGDDICASAGAGVGWHNLVMQSVKKGFWGIENLALIPGTAGAAPIQNIGAYGVELNDIFSHLEAIEIKSRLKRKFTLEECRFGYRNSIFKGELKGRFLITKVYLNLSAQDKPNLEYGDLVKVLNSKKIDKPQAIDIAEAVMEIRRSKLPDPAVFGNAGSFFKNPEVDRTEMDRLKKDYPEIPSFPLENENFKIPAGWLIEKAGWKGKKHGRAGCHDKQALVLINHGGATGAEILELARMIQYDVLNRFGIQLEPEVNIW